MKMVTVEASVEPTPENNADFRAGLESCRMHRCVKHYTVPQLNANESSGSECGACIQSDVPPDYLIAMERLRAANQLLRSAHSIASREGTTTNWAAFLENVTAELSIEHPILWPDREEETLSGMRGLPVFQWAADTAQDASRWTPDNPTFGHCAVAALLVQDTMGGDLMRVLVDGDSHYFNRLPSGTLVDVTVSQFGGREIDYTAAEIRGRDYVLGFPDTARRYDLLKGRCTLSGK